MSTSLRKITPVLLCFILALQQALALGVASWQMSVFQQLAIDDTTLICTGKEMKWISISQTEQAGQFVYLSPDNLTNNPPSVIDCTNHVKGDLVNGISTVADLSVVFTGLVSTINYSDYQSPFAAFTFLRAYVRGPPNSIL